MIINNGATTMRAIIIAIAMLLSANKVFAALPNLTAVSNMYATFPRVAGKTTYNRSEANLHEAKIQMTGGTASAVLTLTLPATITLTRSGGTETASVTYTCKFGTGAFQVYGAGNCVNGGTITLSGTGAGYLSIFPEVVTFDSNNTGGVYIMSPLTVTVN